MPKLLELTPPQNLESLRDALLCRSFSRSERRRLSSESGTQVKGRIAELAMSHTASRVIQACAKHGGDKVRFRAAENVAIFTDIWVSLTDLRLPKNAAEVSLYRASPFADSQRRPYRDQGKAAGCFQELLREFCCAEAHLLRSEVRDPR